MQHDFEAFGLSGYEARVLVALLRVGVATPAQLARLSGVHRTSAYPVLEELAAKGLADVRPGKTAVWASPGTEEVLARLSAIQEERLRGLQARLDQTRAALSRLVPDAPIATMPDAQIIRGAAQVRRIYERLLRSAVSEVLVFNRPPIPGRPAEPTPWSSIPWLEVSRPASCTRRSSSMGPTPPPSGPRPMPICAPACRPVWSTNFPSSWSWSTACGSPKGEAARNRPKGIGRMTPAGVLAEFAIPTFDGFPRGIAVGSDNNLWFTEHGHNPPSFGGGNAIGRIVP